MSWLINLMRCLLVSIVLLQNFAIKMRKSRNVKVFGKNGLKVRQKTMIKIWVDDEREMPKGYSCTACTVRCALYFIEKAFYDKEDVEISLDHDAGKYADIGGDYIKILEKLEELSYKYPIVKDYIKNKITFHLHTANPVGRENMRRIIQKNGWREV